MEDSTYLINLKCKKCGWDWIGTFAYCPYCGRSDVKVVDYETVEEFAERMMEIRERELENAIFVLEDYDWDD
jgi:uncharacterized OB-fold protein